MTLVISKGITLRKGYSSAFADPDVQTYLTAVETNDGQALEYPVAVVISDLVARLKEKSLWSSLEHVVLLSAARTLNGSLVPLKGATPTNVDNNFTQADYDRKTGLKGNASTKRLLTGFTASNFASQDSKHLSVWASEAHPENGTLGTYIASAVGLAQEVGLAKAAAVDALRGNINANANGTTTSAGFYANGFVGISRSSSTLSRLRGNKQEFTISVPSQAPLNTNVGVFAYSNGVNPSSARLAAYTAGSHIDMAALETELEFYTQRLAAVIL
jgi:hypothetical protein